MPIEEKPFSVSYPMCALCSKLVGAEIMDLSIFPPAFFFFEGASFDLEATSRSASEEPNSAEKSLQAYLWVA